MKAEDPSVMKLILEEISTIRKTTHERIKEDNKWKTDIVTQLFVMDERVKSFKEDFNNHKNDVEDSVEDHDERINDLEKTKNRQGGALNLAQTAMNFASAVAGAFAGIWVGKNP